MSAINHFQQQPVTSRRWFYKKNKAESWSLLYSAAMMSQAAVGRQTEATSGARLIIFPSVSLIFHHEVLLLSSVHQVMHYIICAATVHQSQRCNDTPPPCQSNNTSGRRTLRSICACVSVGRCVGRADGVHVHSLQHRDATVLHRKPHILMLWTCKMVNKMAFFSFLSFFSFFLKKKHSVSPMARMRSIGSLEAPSYSGGGAALRGEAMLIKEKSFLHPLTSACDSDDHSGSSCHFSPREPSSDSPKTSPSPSLRSFLPFVFCFTILAVTTPHTQTLLIAMIVPLERQMKRLVRSKVGSDPPIGCSTARVNRIRSELLNTGSARRTTALLPIHCADNRLAEY